MKRLLAKGERTGGVGRLARAQATFLPIAIPFLLLSPGVRQPAQTAQLAPLTTIEYQTLTRTAMPLPEHPFYLTIQPGDTIESILAQGGLPRSEAHLLGQRFSDALGARRLRPGETVRLHRDRNGATDEVRLLLTAWGDIAAARGTDGKFGFEVTPAPRHAREESVAGEIRGSLYEAIQRVGEKPALVQSLVDVFQWDIDFFELQKGDSFGVVVEKRYAGGDLLGYGPIVAARFVHDGRLFEAFRFEAADGTAGYYSSSGTPSKKQFLKSPLKFSRITSGFTKRRFHPILRRFRPHPGIDYGAPTGTPVMSTADGVVIFAGYRPGEGNFIKIRHNSRIETSYLHLSRFAKGIAKGKKVEQGDVIGHVGATGLATGPHLDYRVSDRGEWLNPLMLKSITADPLRGASLRRFHRSVAERLALLGASPARESCCRPAVAGTQQASTLP